METKEYYIDLLETRIIDFNPYWEAPMGETLLRKYTVQAVHMLKSYFNILKEFEKVLKSKKDATGDYNSYPEGVKEAIQSIIGIVNDGRNLWTPTEWKGRTYNHHIQPNGHLQFENDPFKEVKWCASFLDDLEEIINSEKSTANLSKYLDGKWRLFQGYEDGAISVRFTKFNKDKKGKYTFDGDIIFWATSDSRYEGNGIMINEDCKDMPFSELPYCGGQFNSDKELAKFIENHVGSEDGLQTDEEIKEDVHRIMDEYLESCLKI